MEKRDSLGYPAEHKELFRMVESILNSDAEVKMCHKFGDNYTARFLNRRPEWPP